MSLFPSPPTTEQPMRHTTLVRGSFRSAFRSVLGFSLCTLSSVAASCVTVIQPTAACTARRQRQQASPQNSRLGSGRARRLRVCCNLGVMYEEVALSLGLPLPPLRIMSPPASDCLRCGLARSQLFSTRQPDNKVRVLGAAASLVVSCGTGCPSTVVGS